MAGDPSQLQVMYAVDGARELPERELAWLAGCSNSRPVRVGNAASNQLQLDVWGEMLDSMHLSRLHGVPPQDHAWDLEVALLDHLEAAWRDLDNGIWEGRRPRRQFVYSKVMAWVGMDRAVTAVEQYGLSGPVDRWRRIRADIHNEVCREGLDTQRGTFTQFYGSEGLDAALLKIPRLGFLPPHDPRVVGTVRAIDEHLCVDGLILRYDPQLDGGVDALPGTEGTFLACSFWMVDAVCTTGSVSEGTCALRATLVAAQRRRTPQRGVRPQGSPTSGQHPSGIQPRRPDQRRAHAHRSRSKPRDVHRNTTTTEQDSDGTPTS